MDSVPSSLPEFERARIAAMPGPPARQVLFHPDPLRLEEELAARMRAVKTATTPWARILVTVPTQRQVFRLRERLAMREGAWLGVEILHYQALAYRLVESSGVAAPSLLARPVLERILDRILSRRPELLLAQYAHQRPGVLSALLARVEELREAGILAADLETAPAPQPKSGTRQTSLFGESADAPPEASVRELAIVLDDFARAMEALEQHGWTDRPGLARRAAATGSLEFEAAFAYGAYEIVGMHLDLLGALRTARPLLVLVPADLEAPAWAYAREQAARSLGDRFEAIPDEPEGPRDFVAAARALYDPEARAVSSPFISLAHAQGPEAELTLVARRALALLKDGVPAPDIAIIARTLEPYTALAETVFARHRLPVDASASLPLARYPEPRALLLLLRALSGEFERRPVAELVRSPHLARPEWGRDQPLWRPGAWDRWSRTYGITGGVLAWTVELPRLIRDRIPPSWVEEEGPAQVAAFRERREDEARSAELLGRLVAAWDAARARWNACRSAAEHATFLEELRATWIRRPPAAAPRAEGAALDRVWIEALQQLEALAHAVSPSGTEPLSSPAVLEFLTATLETAALPGNDPAGVAFLDARQARGLAFRHVFLIGMNDGWFPQAPRETPLLPDRARRTVRDRTGKPLAVRTEGRMEERLLLAQIVASTVASLTVTWQRADAEGRALAPSLMFRELGRILPGQPSLARLLDEEASLFQALPTEPTLAAAWLERETGLLLREEAALLAAREGPPPESVRRFLDAVDPELARDLSAGLALGQATETGTSLDFDGAIDPEGAWTRAFSAASLQRLARCPLTFFFKDLLRIQPLDEEAREYRTQAREVGELVHRVLEEVYGSLAAQGLLDGRASAASLQPAGRAALDGPWRSILSPLAERMNRRYPLLFEATELIWKEELKQFLEKDLERLAEGGHRLESLEASWNQRIPLTGPDGSGPKNGLSLIGVPDRVTRDRENRLLITDYKTSGKLEKFTLPNNALVGEHLQLPLYMLIAMHRNDASDTEIPGAEILGLGPAFLPNLGFVRRGPERFDPEIFRGIRAGFTESLLVLDRLVERGRFPFRSGYHCRWCPFHVACRRHQISAEARVEEHPDHQDYFKMKKKTKTKPMLADIPEEGDDA
jgi:RecB family exonuclease